MLELWKEKRMFGCSPKTCNKVVRGNLDLETVKDSLRAKL